MFKRSVKALHKIKKEVIGGVVLFVGSIIGYLFTNSSISGFKWPVLALGTFNSVNKNFLGNKRWIWKRKMRRV